MLQIIESDYKNGYFKEYEKIALEWWPKNKFRFETESAIPLAKIIYVLDDSKVIGGFLLTKQVVNRLKEQPNIEYANILSENNYYNLSYFVIEESLRGRGIGTIVLQQFLKSCKHKLWLTAKPQRKEFYERLGFVCEKERINEHNYILLFEK